MHACVGACLKLLLHNYLFIVVPIIFSIFMNHFDFLFLPFFLPHFRCMLMCKWMIRNIEEMGPRFVEPVTDTIDSIYDGMISSTPVIFLLSIGADPTESIEGLARKRKLPGMYFVYVCCFVCG